MIDLPSPLLAADVDLRGLDWMPYYGDHLARSEFNARCSDAAFRAAHNLWWSAWNSVPAASLPDDEVSLTRFADLGRDVKAFRKIRDEALHGFIKCSDGRLYHPFLAKRASEAWDRRVKERERKARWREGRTPDGTGGKTVPETGTSAGQNGSGDGDGTDEKKREDRTGHDLKEERKKDSDPRGSGAEAPSREALVFQRGKALLGKSSGGQITKLRKAYAGDDDAVLAVLREAEAKENAAEWVAATIKRRGEGPEVDDLGLPVLPMDQIGKSTDDMYRRMGVEI